MNRIHSNSQGNLLSRTTKPTPQPPGEILPRTDNSKNALCHSSTTPTIAPFRKSTKTTAPVTILSLKYRTLFLGVCDTLTLGGKLPRNQILELNSYSSKGIHEKLLLRSVA